MRTMLTLEDDLARVLKERAHRSDRSLDELVNETLRRGLAAGEGLESAPEPFVVEAAARGFRPGVDPRRLNQLLDEIEVGAGEEVSGTLSRRAAGPGGKGS